MRVADSRIRRTVRRPLVPGFVAHLDRQVSRQRLEDRTPIAANVLLFHDPIDPLIAVERARIEAARSHSPSGRLAECRVLGWDDAIGSSRAS